MKDHVPDLERCRKLKEMGFPQETEFWWTENKVWEEDPRYRVTHQFSIQCYHNETCAAPIVTELVGELVKIAPRHGRVSDLLDIIVLDDGRARVDRYVSPINGPADTLPNALADLWIWLRERGE